MAKRLDNPNKDKRPQYINNLFDERLQAIGTGNLGKFMDEDSKFTGSVIDTIAGGLLSLLGISRSQLNPDFETGRVLADKVYRLSETILRDYEEKKAQLTPTTSSEFTLQSQINKLYSHYTNEARELMNLSNQLSNDIEKAKAGMDGIFTDRKYFKEQAKHNVNDAKYLEKQAQDLYNSKDKAAQLVNKAIDHNRTKFQRAINSVRKTEGAQNVQSQQPPK